MPCLQICKQRGIKLQFVRDELLQVIHPHKQPIARHRRDKGAIRIPWQAPEPEGQKPIRHGRTERVLRSKPRHRNQLKAVLLQAPRESTLAAVPGSLGGPRLASAHQADRARSEIAGRKEVKHPLRLKRRRARRHLQSEFLQPIGLYSDEPPEPLPHRCISDDQRCTASVPLPIPLWIGELCLQPSSVTSGKPWLFSDELAVLKSADIPLITDSKEIEAALLSVQ